MKQLDEVIICPLTFSIFLEPVVASCGHSFEKEKVIHWLRNMPFKGLKKVPPTCPTCRNEIKEQDLRPNLSLKQVIEVLLTMQPELHDDVYFSTLMVAQLVKNGNISGVLDLFKNKPNRINDIMDGGYTVLQLAIIAGNLRLIKALVENFQTINLNALVQKEGADYLHSPLSLACSMNHVGLTEEQELEIIHYLLEQGANPSLAGSDGGTPLYRTIWLQKPLRTQALLESGKNLNINQKIKEGEYAGFTALTAAIEKNLDRKLVKTLLDIKDIEINIPSEKKGSALYIAAKKGDLALVKTLLAWDDIDPEAYCAEEKMTAEEVASKNKHQQIADLLALPEVRFKITRNKLKVEDYANAALYFSKIYLAKNKTDNNTFNVYFHEYIRVDYKDDPEAYALFCTALLPHLIYKAINDENIDLVLELVKKSTHPIDEEISQGCNVLQLAALLGKLSVVQALVENCKVNIDAKSNLGNTALYIAACGTHSNSSIVKYLLNHNANPNLPNNKGRVPLLGSLLSPENSACTHVLLDVYLQSPEINRLGSFYTLDEFVNHSDLPNFLKLLSCRYLDVNISNDRGETALICAVTTGDIGKTQALLGMPDIDITKRRKSDEKNAYQIAVMSNHQSIKALFDCCELAVGLLNDDCTARYTMDAIKLLNPQMLETLFAYLQNKKFPIEQCQWVVNFFSALQQYDNPTDTSKIPLQLFQPTKEIINSQAELLDRFMLIARFNWSNNNENWEYKIRRTAVNEIKSNLIKLDDQDQTEYLHFIRNKPIITMHRHWYSFWPTTAAREVDRMINTVDQRLNKKLFV